MELWGLRQKSRDFPGDPVAKTLLFKCRRPGYDPWWGNEIPHAATKIKNPVCPTKTRHSQIKKKKERKIIYMQNCTQCLAYDKQCVLVWINILMYIASVTYYFYPSSKDCTTWRIHNRLHRHLLQSLKMEIFTAIKNQLSCLCKHLHNNHLNTEVANHVTNFCLSLHYALKNQVSKTLSNHYLVWGVLLISPLYT